MSVWQQEGLPVRVRNEFDIRSTMEFIGKEGKLMSMTSNSEKRRITEGYVKIKFPQTIRNRRWWWIPISDLEDVMPIHPTWVI
jgi:hypothetical protein